MKASVAYVAAAVMVLVAAGCAGKPVIWRAAPSTVSASAADADIVMEPLRQDNPFYTAFRLMITNTGSTDVAVDWNRSGYLINDRAGGRLWFKGVTAQAIREKSVPADTVAPGDTVSRVVAPLQLVAITPLKQSTRQESSFSAGQLPAGKNSIRLTLIRSQTDYPVILSVTITTDDTQ